MKLFSYCDLALDNVFKVLWQGKDPFEEGEKLEGIDFRKVKTRRTFRFEVAGKGYFAKVCGQRGNNTLKPYGWC